MKGAAKIEVRAQKIADPLERLRYLRRATAGEPVDSRRQWLAFLAVAALVLPQGSSPPRRPVTAVPSRIDPLATPNVWLVERHPGYEVYSNGLRVENELAVANEPRSYTLFSLDGEAREGPRREQPSGIVFHTTESMQAPFEAKHNGDLKRIGRDLMLYVRNKRAYHFLIDRFGRVHRIVMESDTANHAGHSVWADSRWLYVGLNHCFLGVALEARTQPDQPPINQAQIHAAAVVTEMLRSKYNLAAENCVTHAQVSVNPDSMKIGWHTDWGSGFPFRQVGLPDNYGRAHPAVYAFGFEPDPAYREATSPEVWHGLELADEQVRQSAAKRGMTVTQYKRFLRQRYLELTTALRERGAIEEN